MVVHVDRMGHNSICDAAAAVIRRRKVCTPRLPPRALMRTRRGIMRNCLIASSRNVRLLVVMASVTCFRIGVQTATNDAMHGAGNLRYVLTCVMNDSGRKFGLIHAGVDGAGASAAIAGRGGIVFEEVEFGME